MLNMKWLGLIAAAFVLSSCGLYDKKGETASVSIDKVEVLTDSSVGVVITWTGDVKKISATVSCEVIGDVRDPHEYDVKGSDYTFRSFSFEETALLRGVVYTVKATGTLADGSTVEAQPKDVTIQ